MDVIRLENMVFYGYHGVTAAEKETGRRYEVDCELETDLAAHTTFDAHMEKTIPKAIATLDRQISTKSDPLGLVAPDVPA